MESKQRENLQGWLNRLGFANSEAILTTAQLVSDPGIDASSQIVLKDPSSNANGIWFVFSAVSPPEGDGFTISKITATKEYRPKIDSKEVKTIQQTYSYLGDLPTKEQMTKNMLLQVRQERNRQDLFENRLLRKEMKQMGFDYDKLVAGAFEIVTMHPTFRGVTIMREETPIRGKLLSQSDAIHFRIHLRRPLNEKHRIESIFVSRNKGRNIGDHAPTDIEFIKEDGPFPSKSEMIDFVMQGERRRIEGLSKFRRYIPK